MGRGVAARKDVGCGAGGAHDWERRQLYSLGESRAERALEERHGVFYCYGEHRAASTQATQAKDAREAKEAHGEMYILQDRPEMWDTALERADRCLTTR